MADIFEKTGAHMKGKPPPVRIRDVERVDCPAVSKPGMIIMHSIINLYHGGSVCEFCKVSWVDLDTQIREEAAEAASIKWSEGSRRRT